MRARFDFNYFVFLIACLWATWAFTGCASNPIERKREHVLDCTKELIEYDAGAYESFQVCRQVYRLKMIGEP